MLKDFLEEYHWFFVLGIVFCSPSYKLYEITHSFISSFMLHRSVVFLTVLKFVIFELIFEAYMNIRFRVFKYIVVVSFLAFNSLRHFYLMIET